MIAALPRRFDVVLTGDSLRLGTPKDADRCVVTLLPDVVDGDAGAAVRIHLPKEDRRAYARTCRSFNRVMDRHDQRRPPEVREIDPRQEALRAAVFLHHGEPTAD